MILGIVKFWFFDRFYFTFLANYPANFDIKGLIKWNGCWKPAFRICSAQFVE